MTAADMDICGVSIDLGSYAFTPDDITGFARRYDFQPFHLSEEAARKMHFGALAASGWHTAAIFSAMLNKALPGHPLLSGVTLGPWKRIDQLRWVKPVRAGDELTFKVTVVSAIPADDMPGWQVAALHGEGTNQNGETAYILDADLLLLT